MTREDIEKAANAYMDDFLYDHIDHTAINHEEDNYEAGRNHALFEFGTGIFKDGAAWRINSVWHSASEKPEKKPALVEYSHFPKGHGYLVVPDPREVLGSITRYAYIEDLIPNTEE